MKAEEKLVNFVCDTRFEDISASALNTVKRQMLAVAGTTIAGAAAEGCEAAVQFYQGTRRKAGSDDSHVWRQGPRSQHHFCQRSYGARSRFLRFHGARPPPGLCGDPCGAGSSGARRRMQRTRLHFGSGRGDRGDLAPRPVGGGINGFDPTGICVPFGAAAAAARILGLGPMETWNALAMAFNSCGGSFQSHRRRIAGRQVRAGTRSQSGVIGSRLALKGITGPRNFLDGVYGYFHLYGKDLSSGETGVSELGSRWDLLKLVFKKYPDCALTAEH